MIVGILEVNIRSVFLHQGLHNAVVAIERGYLNGIKSVLGDEIRLDILKDYCWQRNLHQSTS